MRSLVLPATLLSISLVACSGAHERPSADAGPGDGAISDGGSPSDAGMDATTPTDAGADASMPPQDAAIPTWPQTCGNGVLELGEQCDDGNTTPGDGCSADCQWEAFCGNGHVDPGEVCDDGNNRSGDGCRSDCMSDETCGNNQLDVAAGEVCDGTPGCAPDCMSVTTCGNGTIDTGEQCDDGNTAAFDGCGPDCRKEISLLIDTVSIAGSGTGCDYTGDGVPDNAVGKTLDSVSATAFGLPIPLNGLIRTTITNLLFGTAQPGAVLQFLGLDDVSGATDPSITIRTAPGTPVAMMGMDGGVTMTDGGMNMLPDAGTDAGAGMDASIPMDASITDAGAMLSDAAAGRPQYTIQLAAATQLLGSLDNHFLSAGPEQYTLDLSMLPLPGLSSQIGFTMVRIEGNTTASGGELDAIPSGLVCGVASISALALVPDPVPLLLGLLPDAGTPPPACDGSSNSTVADVLVGGTSIPLNLPGLGQVTIHIPGSQPDVDVDGDGLERFEVDDQGPPGCQPVITACVDGDGTRVPGHDCVTDPRFADGFTAALDFSASRIDVVGAN